MALCEFVPFTDGAFQALGGDPDGSPFMTWAEVEALENECREKGLIK